MGYNTVAFLLNDNMHRLQDSPRTVTWALTHPPLSNQEFDQKRWREQVSAVADDYKEPRLHTQALEVLGTFHADFHQWIFAGGNYITTLRFVGYGKTKDGKLTVTLEVPADWPHHPENFRKGEK